MTTCQLSDFIAVLNDGVTGDTTLIVKLDGVVQTIRIDELYEILKEHEVEIWQDGKFSGVQRFERLCTAKQIVRVLTFSGVVDCTSDYQLLKSNGSLCRPQDIPLKSTLLHESNDALLLKSLAILPKEIECKEAYEMGAFLRFGNCCELSAESGRDWVIQDSNRQSMERIKSKLHFPTVLHDPIPPSNKFQLRLLCDERPIVARYCELFYNKHNEPRVPSFIMQSNIDVVKSFWEGYASDNNEKQHVTVPASSKQLATDLWLLARRLGYHVVLYDCLASNEYNTSAFQLHCLRHPSRYKPTEIKQIYEISATGEPSVVYDIETKNHRFNAAPGNLILGRK